MTVYILTIFSVLLFGMIDAKINHEQKWSFSRFLILAILVCVSGFRYQVGTDYGAYAGGFPRYFHEPLFENASGLFGEPGIRILAKVIGLMYFDYAIFIFACSLITVGLYITTLSKVSDKFWLSVLLFIFIGSWAVSFNAVRQCLAASIIFAGHKYIYDRKFFKWCIIVFLAMLFHTSALFCIIFYFIPVKQMKPWGLLIMIAIAASGSLLYDYLFSARAILKDYAINETGMIYATRSVNILRIVIAWVPVVLYLIFLRTISAKNSKFSFYMNLTIINAVVATVTKDSAVFFRLGIYSQIFLAISWPMILSYFPKQIKTLATFGLLAVYFIWFFYELGNNVNFNWIFDRPGKIY